MCYPFVWVPWLPVTPRCGQGTWETGGIALVLSRFSANIEHI